MAYSNEKLESLFGQGSITTSSTLNGWGVVTLTNSASNTCAVVPYGTRKSAEAAPGTAMYLPNDTSLKMRAPSSSGAIGTVDTTHGKMVAVTFNITPECHDDGGHPSPGPLLSNCDTSGNALGTAAGLGIAPAFDGSLGLVITGVTYANVSGSLGRTTTTVNVPGVQFIGKQVTFVIACLKTGTTSLPSAGTVDVITYILYLVNDDRSLKELYSFDAAAGAPGNWVIETGTGSLKRFNGRISGLVTADIGSFADVAYTTGLVLPPTTGQTIHVGDSSSGTADGSSAANKMSYTTFITDTIANAKTPCIFPAFFFKNSNKALPVSTSPVAFRNLWNGGLIDFRGTVVKLYGDVTNTIHYSGLMRITKKNCGMGIDGNGVTLSGFQDVTSSFVFDSNATHGKNYKFALPTCHFLWQDALAVPYTLNGANTDASAKTALNAATVTTWAFGDTNLYLMKADSVAPASDGHIYYLSGQGFSMDVGSFYIRNLTLRGLGVGIASNTDGSDPLDQQCAITHSCVGHGFLDHITSRVNPGKHEIQMSSPPRDPGGSCWYWEAINTGEGCPTTAFGFTAGAFNPLVWYFDAGGGMTSGNRAAVINCSSTSTNTMAVLGVSGGLPTQNSTAYDFDSHGTATGFNQLFAYEEFSFIGNSFTNANMRSAFCNNPIDFYGNNTAAATFDPNGLGLNVLTSSPIFTVNSGSTRLRHRL
jgi:hypothetical protein